MIMHGLSVILHPIPYLDYGSVMLKGISWDALSFPGTFQNGRLKKFLKI